MRAETPTCSATFAIDSPDSYSRTISSTCSVVLGWCRMVTPANFNRSAIVALWQPNSTASSYTVAPAM